MMRQHRLHILSPRVARYIQLLFTLSIIPYMFLRETVGVNYYPLKVTWSLFTTSVMVITYLSVNRVLPKPRGQTLSRYSLYIGLGLYLLLTSMKILHIPSTITNPFEFVAAVLMVQWLRSLMMWQENRKPYQNSMALTGMVSYLLFGTIYLVPMGLYQHNFVVASFLIGLGAYLLHSILLYLFLHRAGNEGEGPTFPDLIDSLGQSASQT